VVAQLVVLDDGQRGVGFAQTDAVGQDAAVVGVDLVDRAFGAVLLEVEQRLPDVGIDDGGLVEKLGIVFLPGQEALEDVKQRLEVDELRGVIDVELLQVAQDLCLHVGDQLFVAQISSNHCLSSARSRSPSTIRLSSMLGVWTGPARDG
jgi:hypothetical protein